MLLSGGLTRSQILGGYKSALHEYRALQSELAPWTAAFKEQHGRKPRIADVERTVCWLKGCDIRAANKGLLGLHMCCLLQLEVALSAEADV